MRISLSTQEPIGPNSKVLPKQTLMKTHPKFPHSALKIAKYVLKCAAIQSRAAAANCQDDWALKALNILSAEGYEADLDELERFTIQWCNGEFTETTP